MSSVEVKKTGRTNIIKEVIETEELYVRNLELLDQVLKK
jgi:hypothetical protein